VCRGDIDPADEVRLWLRLAQNGASRGQRRALLWTSSCSIPAMAMACGVAVGASGMEGSWRGLQMPEMRAP
jgi:hypothetical protein